MDIRKVKKLIELLDGGARTRGRRAAAGSAACIA